jgi:hypothetical protein
VALGVIVLAGADTRDESLRRFAETLVDRPGPTVLVWTHDDVRALGTDQAAVTEVEAAAAEPAPTRTADVPTGERAHTGKYRPLWEWLLQQERREIQISFSDLERQAGITLPDSCRAHPAHWHSYQGSAVVRAIVDAGGTQLASTSTPAWCRSCLGPHRHGGRCVGGRSDRRRTSNSSQSAVRQQKNHEGFAFTGGGSAQPAASNSASTCPRAFDEATAMPRNLVFLAVIQTRNSA